MVYANLPQRGGKSIPANTNNPPQDPPPIPEIIEPLIAVPKVTTPKITPPKVTPPKVTPKTFVQKITSMLKKLFSGF